MAFVRETADGWEVVEGASVLSTHTSQIEALDAALARNGGKTKDPILRDPDSKELNGAWRWLHATDVEDVPAYDGARIDATTVAQAVENLNSQDIPRPINGGTADSVGHGDAGQTLANGYAHHAVEVEAKDGRRGAYVIAEIVPDVARNIDAGRIAYTSIGLGGTTSEEDAAIRDAFFDHLALTNTPAITTLQPSAAIRKSGERLVALRSHRVNLKRTAPMADNTAPVPAAPPVAVRAELDPKVAEAIAKAMEGGITPEALIAAIEACKPAEAMESEAAKAKADAADATRSQSLETLTAEVAALRADKEARDDEAWLDAEVAKRKVALRAERREPLLRVLRTDRKGGRETVSGLIADMPVPPHSGSVLPKVAPVTGEPDEDTGAAIAKRATSLLPALRTQFPGEPEHLLIARAQKAARAV